MSLRPREYQRRAIDAILARRDAGDRRTLAVMPTGSGKTVVAAHVADALKGHGRIMVLCHRDELVRQAVDKFTAVTGVAPAVEKADERSDEDAMFGKPQIVVSSVQTLNSGSDEKGWRMEKFDPKDFAFLWADECFVAGTLIDGRPIEKIRAGEYVRSFNHATGRVERRRVLRTFKSRPRSLLTVRLDNGTEITCTWGHPFFSGGKYRGAWELLPGDWIQTEPSNETTDLHSVRHDLRPTQREKDVFAGMRSGEAAGDEQDAPGGHALRPLRDACVAGRKGGPRDGAATTPLLFARVLEGSPRRTVIGDNGADQPAVRFGPDDATESDAAGRESGEDVGDAARDGLGAASTGRQRQWSDATRADVLRCDGLASAGRTDADGAGQRLPFSLQNRLRKQGTDDRGGDRRTLPRRGRTQTARPEEGCVFGVARVEGVSFHQRTDRAGFGRVCPDGHVYNLEVDGNHNYYAGGCLVHNCHHSVAKSWGRAIEYFAAGNPDLFVLGVTATPDRADGEALGRVFQSCAFNYELPDIIRDGYLVRVMQRAVELEGVSLANVGTRAGDLNNDELETILLVEKPLLGVAYATIEVAYGLPKDSLKPLAELPEAERHEAVARLTAGRTPMPTLLFTGGVFRAWRLAEVINRWVPGSAAHVAGDGNPDKGFMPFERRRHTLDAFGRGEIQFLCNCDVASEGYDEPRIQLIVMARPTKSRAKYIQMIGRGTRPAVALAGMLGDLPDAASRRAVISASIKPAVTVLDFTCNSGRHKLVTAADVLGGEQYDAEVVERANQKAQEQAVDVETALAQAQREIEDEQEQARRDALEAQVAADAEEQRRQAEAARRAGLVGTAVYRVRDVDGFDPYAIEPPRRSEVSEGGATEGQIGFLVKLGVRQATAAMYSKRQAGAVIESIKAKRCTDNQAKFLMRWYTRAEIAGMNFAAASAAIEACKANGNRRPAREQAA